MTDYEIETKIKDAVQKESSSTGCAFLVYLVLICTAAYCTKEKYEGLEKRIDAIEKKLEASK